MTLKLSVELPKNFRIKDFLAFHNRDQQAVAEQVLANRLRKGIMWDGNAACMTIEFHHHQAGAELAVDGARITGQEEKFRTSLHRMLGMTQQTDLFEQTFHSHPQLGLLIARQAGLRVPQSASAFEAITWAITGQQISVSAAISLRRKLILAAGVSHSSGIACYPDAERVTSLNGEDLRQAGFSKTKAQTLLTLSRLVTGGQLPLDDWVTTLPVDTISEQLLKIRGIGHWTVNYALLRGFGWLDGSLHGDAAVRRGIQTILNQTDKVSEEQAKEWLIPFSPWRALVAAHLWAACSPHSPEQ
jgi:DNA-3-methyladenine glycosylase II